MTFRKISLALLGAALVLGLGVGGAKAEFPDKPITLILPLGAGGSHDRNARVFTSTIPTYLGNAIIVKLMPGASGQTGRWEIWPWLAALALALMLLDWVASRTIQRSAASGR